MKKSLIIIVLLLLIGIILYLSIGFISMDNEVGRFYYSKSLEEAEKEKSIINKYFVYDTNKKQISDAWLEYARSHDIFNNEKIETDKILLNIKNVKEFEEIKDVYWEAFFKNKKLTAFEDNEIISVVGVDKSMDTIIIKPNKNETFYVIKTRCVLW